MTFKLPDDWVRGVNDAVRTIANIRGKDVRRGPGSMYISPHQKSRFLGGSGGGTQSKPQYKGMLYQGVVDNEAGWGDFTLINPRS